MARLAPLLVALLLIGCGDDPTPAPQLREPDAGDEAGIRVPVRVTVTGDAVAVRPRRVAAFLPLRFRIVNDGPRRATVRITGQPVVRLGAGLTSTLDAEGRKPGKVRIRAGGGRTAVLSVDS